MRQSDTDTDEQATKRERRCAALHEAGHCVAALATGHAVRLVRASIDGVCVIAHDYRSVRAGAAILCAGEVAERLHTGHGSYDGARIDRALLAELSRDRRVWDQGARDAERILRANAGAVVRLADRLAAVGTMTGAEVLAAVGTITHEVL